MGSKGTFGTVINCIDGRVQLPVIEWMKESFSLDYVDSVTLPGADMVLAVSEERSISVKEKVNISVNAHGSKIVAVCGHYDCAANPVEEEEHREHIRKAVERVGGWGLPAETIGLWVGADSKVERVV